MARPKRRTHTSKFGAIRTEIDGIKFASKVEGRRYEVLKEQQKRGRIHNLILQPRFKIRHTEKGKPVCTYVADFMYTRDGKEVIEDVKGIITDVFKLKKKMMGMMKVTGPDGVDRNGVHITIVKSVYKRKGVYAWSVDGMIEETP